MGFNSEKALGNTDQRSSAICCPQGWHTKPLRAGLSLPLQGPWPLSFPHPTTSHTSDAEVLLLLVLFSQLDNSSLPPGDAPFLVLQELALLWVLSPQGCVSVLRWCLSPGSQEAELETRILCQLLFGEQSLVRGRIGEGSRSQMMV